MPKVKEMQAVVKDVYLPNIHESGMQEYRCYRSHQNPNNFLRLMPRDIEGVFRAHVNPPHVQKAEADFVSKGILITASPRPPGHCYALCYRRPD
jgi:quinol monooxygenase YgiN